MSANTFWPAIVLNDGKAMPSFGLGVWYSDVYQAQTVTFGALAAGYRSVEAAASMEAEKGVGRALRNAYTHLGLERPDIFVSCQLKDEGQDYDLTRRTMDHTLAGLEVDGVDLCLVIRPDFGEPFHPGFLKALRVLKLEGRIGCLGVRDGQADDIDRLSAYMGERPVLNQLSLFPDYRQCELCDAMRERGLTVEARAPLINTALFRAPLLLKLSQKHRKSPAQIILRWHLDCGHVIRTEAQFPSRLLENPDIFDFRLDLEDLRQIALLDGGPGSLHPSAIYSHQAAANQQFPM